jgi:hypothetical protein
MVNVAFADPAASAPTMGGTSFAGSSDAVNTAVALTEGVVGVSAPHAERPPTRVSNSRTCVRRVI